MSSAMHGKPLDILLVEDDPGDVDLTREVLEDAKIKVNLNVVEDGVLAIDYLRRQGEYQDVERPDVILLDLNLPRKDGREVLADIKADEELRRIPVVVLTTSSAHEDILKTYTLGCNCYVTKPVGLDQFAKVVRTIEDFWFTIVKLPSHEQIGTAADE